MAPDEREEKTASIQHLMKAQRMWNRRKYLVMLRLRNVQASAGVFGMAKFLGIWAQMTHAVAERDDRPKTMGV